MTTLSESLHKIANGLEDWEGDVAIHTHVVTSTQELRAWARLFDKVPMVMHSSCRDGTHWLHGSIGPIKMYVNYQHGLLGEEPLPPPVKVKTPSTEDSQKRLEELLR